MLKLFIKAEKGMEELPTEDKVLNMANRLPVSQLEENNEKYGTVYECHNGRIVNITK